MPAVGAAPRYLHIDNAINTSGIAGTSAELYDLTTGRFVAHVRAGAASYTQGFDGVRGWGADASGMVLIDDTRDGTLDDVLFSHFLGRTGPERVEVVPLPAGSGRRRLRLRLDGLSGPIDVTLNPATGMIETIDDYSGVTKGSLRLWDYRLVKNVWIPFESDSRSIYSDERETATAVYSVAHVPDDAFDPPEPPRDTSLDGVTSVPMDLSLGQVVIPIRIDGGPILHVLFDSGSTNYLSPATARRLGLTITGFGRAGGIGAEVVDQHLTRARLVRIGRAEIRGLPFAVLDDGSKLDGTIGCEVFERFAVRFDFRNRRVQLSRDPSAIRGRGRPFAIRTGRCQPELDAELDGLVGVAAIDTGSAAAADIMAPFVAQHHLIDRYQARVYLSGGEGIGGAAAGRFARAHVLRIGPFLLRDVEIGLSLMKKGAFTDPTEMVNLGVPLLSRFDLTIDYRSHRLWLEPRASLRGIRLEGD